MGEKREEMVVVCETGSEIKDAMALTIISGILLIALLTEIIFRMINRFSAETREVFRWVYMIGCGMLILVMMVREFRKPPEVIDNLSSLSGWLLVIPVAALIITVILNKKEIK